MSKIIKKVTGVVLMIALLVTTAGTSAEAAKRVKWPYGTYKCVSKGCKTYRIYWGYASEPTEKYPELVYMYEKGDVDWILEPPLQFKATNKINVYKTEKIGKSYETIKVSKKYLRFKEYIDGKLTGNWKFKIQKRLPKNVG